MAVAKRAGLAALLEALLDHLHRHTKPLGHFLALAVGPVLFHAQETCAARIDLAKASFVNRGGKGSHRNYEHPSGYRLLVSVHQGEARPYQPP